MIELDLDGVRRQADTWHKVLSVARECGMVTITVVRGLRIATSPPIVSDMFQLKSTPELETYLASPEFQRKLFQPSKRGIVLIDVAGYSLHDTLGQSAILTMFYESLQLAEASNDLFSREPSIDQIVPTGDGCFIVFKPQVNDHVFKSVFSIHASFCAYQKRLLKQQETRPVNEMLGVRLACHVGDVDFIVDAAGNRNAYGTGLNETARILQYGRASLKKRLGEQDPVSVAFYGSDLNSQADALATYFQRLAGVKLKLTDLGTVSTKHNLKLCLRCLTNLPSHVVFPFNSPIPQEHAPRQV